MTQQSFQSTKCSWTDLWVKKVNFQLKWYLFSVHTFSENPDSVLYVVFVHVSELYCQELAQLQESRHVPSDKNARIFLTMLRTYALARTIFFLELNINESQLSSPPSSFSVTSLSLTSSGPTRTVVALVSLRFLKENFLSSKIEARSASPFPSTTREAVTGHRRWRSRCQLCRLAEPPSGQKMI